MEQLLVDKTLSEKLHNLVDRILAKEAMITDIGLNGKMGAAIFLYHYASCYNNAACVQVAGNLLEDVRSNIAEITSIDVRSGLIGIDAGLKYLYKNGFIDTAMSEMPAVADQRIYKALLDFPREHIHECFQSLLELGKYFMQDDRKRSMTTTGPFSDFNRKCVLHFIDLLSLPDVKMIAQLNHKYILQVVDTLCQIHSTRSIVNDVQRFLPLGLQSLEYTLFNNVGFKPFAAGSNPFCIAVALLQLYGKTYRLEFATLAVRLLEKYEEDVNTLYMTENIGNTELLLHAIACNKLHSELRDKSFNNYARTCLELYRERENSDNNTVQNSYQNDFSLQSGYAAEGMALLTLEGHIHPDWLEDLIGCY
ncbi:MAG TPA: hypothetical protein VIM79_25710 [Niastella sp.]